MDGTSKLGVLKFLCDLGKVTAYCILNVDWIYIYICTTPPLLTHLSVLLGGPGSIIIVYIYIYYYYYIYIYILYL